MEKRFVPQPAIVNERNWCVPYATAALLGKTYDEIYALYCKNAGRQVTGVGRAATLKMLRQHGIDTKYVYHNDVWWKWLADTKMGFSNLPPFSLYHIEKWVKVLKKYYPEYKDARYFMIEVTGHEMLWDDKDKLVIDNYSKAWIKPQDHRWKRKRLQAYAPIPEMQEIGQVKQVGQSNEAKRKKVYYNRVRRTCKKYGIKISYIGEHKNYTKVQLHTPIKVQGQTLYGVLTLNVVNNDIDWENIHNYLLSKGYKGGAK